MVECLAQIHTDWFLLSTVKPVKICHWLVKLGVDLVAREVLEGCQCSSFFFQQTPDVSDHINEHFT